MVARKAEHQFGKTSPEVVKKNKFCGFYYLPTEMVEHILNKLELEDKKSARLACTYWKIILERGLRYTIPLTDSTWSELNSKEYKINELTVMLDQLTFRARLPLKMKESLKTVKALNFMANSDDEISHVIVDTVGVKSLIKACQQIERLRFDFMNMKACKSNALLELNTVQLQFLTTLQVRQPFGGPIHVASSLFSLTTPCLRNLEVERFGVGSTGTRQDEQLYVTLQKCLARNRGTLKTLKIINWLTNIHIAPFSGAEYPPGLLEELTQLNLDELEIRHREEFWLYHLPFLNPMLFNLFGMEGWAAANRLLNNQRSLKVLKLNTNCTAIIQRSYLLLTANRLTLTKVELDLTGALLDFDIRILSLLPALKDFSFRSDDYEFGPFPASLRTLYWDAPLGLGWYLPGNQQVFSGLENITLGERAQRYMNLRNLCLVLSGSPNQAMNLQRLTLERRRSHAVPNGRMETRSMAKRRNEDLQTPLSLPAQVFQVEYDDQFIHISLK